MHGIALRVIIVSFPLKVIGVPRYINIVATTIESGNKILVQDLTSCCKITQFFSSPFFHRYEYYPQMAIPVPALIN